MKAPPSWFFVILATAVAGLATAFLSLGKTESAIPCGVMILVCIFWFIALRQEEKFQATEAFRAHQAAVLNCFLVHALFALDASKLPPDFLISTAEIHSGITRNGFGPFERRKFLTDQILGYVDVQEGKITSVVIFPNTGRWKKSAGSFRERIKGA